MRISDWSSDVCSSDLPLAGFRPNSYGEMEAIWVRHDRTDNAVIVAEGLVETQESHGVLGWLGCPVNPRSEERRVGKELSVRVDLGGRRIIKKNTSTTVHK